MRLECVACSYGFFFVVMPLMRSAVLVALVIGCLLLHLPPVSSLKTYTHVTTGDPVVFFDKVLPSPRHPCPNPYPRNPYPHTPTIFLHAFSHVARKHFPLNRLGAHVFPPISHVFPDFTRFFVPSKTCALRFFIVFPPHFLRRKGCVLLLFFFIITRLRV